MGIRRKSLNLITRLSESHKEYRVKLGQVNQKHLHVSPPNKWNIIQVLEHINFSQQGTISYINKKRQASHLVKPGIKTQFRMLLLKAFFRFNLKLKAPSVLPSPPRECNMNDIFESYQKSIAELELLASELEINQMEGGIFRHPIAGRINFYQTCVFLYLHWIHHSKQIDKLLQLHVEEK